MLSKKIILKAVTPLRELHKGVTIHSCKLRLECILLRTRNNIFLQKEQFICGITSKIMLKKSTMEPNYIKDLGTMKISGSSLH